MACQHIFYKLWQLFYVTLTDRQQTSICYSWFMKVTKYPQSCLLLEKDGKRIVIDPGRFFTQKYDVGELGKLEAVLYTHQHGDHFDQSLVDGFKKQGVPIYANEAVCELIGDTKCNVSHSAGFEVAGFDVMPHDLPHFPIKGDPPQNTGYIIDGNFFHPGDGVKTTGVSASNLAAPIAGGFGFDDVIDLAKSIKAKKLIPIHYTNQQMYPVDVNEFKSQAEGEFEVIVLADGESTEL